MLFYFILGSLFPWPDIYSLLMTIKKIIRSVYLGVDTGGTFTDFVLFDGGRVRVHKVLSTPSAPEQAILQGILELGLENTPFQLIHGSTVATNALLEGKGVRTAYITNKGFTYTSTNASGNESIIRTINSINYSVLYSIRCYP